MPNLKLYIIVIITILSTARASSQGKVFAEDIIQQRIEELSSRTDVELDFSELYDHFLELYTTPININTATKDDLQRLMFLNDNQIVILLQERDARKGFQTIYELKTLDGFSLALILSIEPFITFNLNQKTEPIKLNKILKYGDHQILIRHGIVVDNQQINSSSQYLGSPDKLYFKYQFKYKNNVSFGILGDKDAGEEFFKGYNKNGFDFYSAHFYVKNIGKLKAAVIGDYHLEFGQGLTLWSGLGFGKSATSINLQRQGRGISPNTSSNEILYFRGAAANYSLLSSLSVTGFYSSKKLDAGLTYRDTSDSQTLIFSSIQESGYHRTVNEMANKNSVKEQIYGANLNYNKNGLHIGATAYKTTYNKELLKSPSPYQIFDFQGRENINAGIDASFANKYLSTFGEVSVSKNSALGVLAGAYINLHPRLTFSIYYRNFDKDFQNFYSIPISENSKPQNEKGLYLGSLIQLGARNSLIFYYDIFKFPWLKYRVNSPSDGEEFSFQWERNCNRNLMYYIRYQYESKIMNLSNSILSTLEITSQNRHNLRFNLIYIINDIKLETRISLSKYEQQSLEKTNGYLIFQDLSYSFKKMPLVLSLRYALYNTDDYYTRIYAYEKDVLYKFSIPAYYYQGQRYYIVGKYNLTKSLSLWLKLSQTVSSNTDLVKSEITTQLRWVF